MNLKSAARVPARVWRASLIGLACVACQALAAPLSLKPLTYRGTMPFVQSDNVNLAQRINNLIYLAVLDLPAPVTLQNGLNEHKSEDGVHPLSDIAFEVGRNDERILALSVSAEGCGAYCENFTTQFNFELFSGRQLVASDLFTPAGSARLIKQLQDARVSRVSAEIARLRRDVKAAGQKAASTGKANAAPKEEDGDLTNAIEMYERCVATFVDPAMAKYLSIDSDGLKIGADAITFTRGRCSNHAMRALDDLHDFNNTLSLTELTPYLNEYGKSLLLGDGKVMPSGGPFSQVLNGKVGQSSITLRLGARNSDNSVSATYYYNRFRKPIPLFGKVAGNVLTLEENNPSGTATATIRATISGGSLKGNWIGNGKQVAFEAGPR